MPESSTPYSLRFSPEAAENFAALPKAMKRRVKEKLCWLAAHVNEVSHKPLKGFGTKVYRLRVGDWRVFYTLHYPQKMLVVHAIGHRRDIYE